VNTAIYSPSGASAEIGFAVPVEVVNRTVPEIIKHGKVIRPGIGVSVANERIAERLGVKGVLIINVQPGSSAESAGLRGTVRTGDELILGDIIESINGKAISSYDDLRNQLDRYHVGDEVAIGILRNSDHVQIKVMLEEAV
jgi:S1-C subfamily serine protease